MYYPFLPARFTSFAALERLVAKGTLSKKIIPVIEQIRVHDSLCTIVDIFVKNQHRIALYFTHDLIEDLQHGFDPRRQLFVEKLRRLITSQYVKLVIAVDEYFGEKTLTWLEKNLGVCRANLLFSIEKASQQDYFAPTLSWDTEQTIFVYANVRNIRKLKNKVLLQSIPADDTCTGSINQFITDLPYYCAQDGFMGFADRLLRSPYYESDSMVRLPILYAKNKEIWLRVFAPVHNARNPPPMSLAREFHHMLPRIIAWCYEQKIGATMGLAHLLEDFKRRAYPGSVVLQMRTIMHALEIMSRAIDQH